MNIKEFFRPTIAKIVIFIIIAILAFTLGLNRGEFNQGPQVPSYIQLAPSICSETLIFSPIFWPVMTSNSWVCADFRNTNLRSFILLVGISSIIYWYLISCLIIFIYQKIKSKS